MSWVVQPARTLDAGGAGAVLSQCNDAHPFFARQNSRAEEVALIARMINDGWVQVIWRAGRVVGFSARDNSELHCLYVAPDMQGRGVGGALMRQAQETSRSLRLWTYLEDEVAQSFYRAHGFYLSADTGYAGNDAGLPELRMEWTRTG